MNSMRNRAYHFSNRDKAFMSKSNIAAQTEHSVASKTGSRRSLTVVIPVLNEERGLDALVAALTPVLDATKLTWDIIFIDDGSTDQTLSILRTLNERDTRFRTVAFSRNFGKETAVAAGLQYATGDGVVLMDADLQHPPDVITRFVQHWREGFDIVYGQRDDRNADGPAREAFSRAFYNLFRKMSGTTLPDGAGDFRLLDRKAVNAMNSISERTRFNKGLYAWIGFKSMGVPFHVPPRFDGGQSRWKPKQLARFALDGIVSFSTVPLKIWSYLGLMISALSFTYVLGFLTKTLIYGRDPTAPGFPTLIIAVMFLGGVQLISLGVIGEYIGRMYEEVKARPMYLVADEIGISPATRGAPHAVKMDAPL
jgi:polyisoprenyl-phosphate glycosyltransferase